MSGFSFRPAKREGVGVLLGVMGPTGSGKTFSALRLAKGLSGDRRFAVIDTEAGRAKHYADLFAFDHGDLGAPFRPDVYADAIMAADKAGYPAVVVDSTSHVWAGEGGVLDWQEEELDRMAGDDWKRREACKMAAWIKPKQSNKQMVNKLLQLRCHLILCFRAEQKIEMVRDGKTGKLEIVEKTGPTSLHGWTPICEKNLPFELTASFLLTADAPGVPKPLKVPEPLKGFFSATRQLDEVAGERVAEWAAGGHMPDAPKPNGAAEQPARPVDPPPPALNVINDKQRSRLFATLKRVGRKDADLRDFLGRELGIQSTKEIPVHAYNRVLEWAAEPLPAKPTPEAA